MQSAKILLLLSGLIVAFLPGCVSSPARGDSTASDLDVMVLGVQALLRKRSPEGEVKRAEDAVTTEQAWTLLLDLEDIDFLHEQDKEITVEFVTKAAARIKESRRPCTTFDHLFNRRECK